MSSRGRGRGINVEMLAKLGVKTNPSKPSGRGTASAAMPPATKIPSAAIRSQSQGHKLVKEFAQKLHDSDENTVTLHRMPQEHLGTQFGDDLRLEQLSVGDSPANRAGLGRFINRRLTHINDVAVSSPSDVLVAAQNAATMALRFEAQRSASRTDSNSRGPSPALTPATIAAALKVNQAPKTIELVHDDKVAKVRLSSDPATDIQKQVEAFNIENPFHVVDEFGREVKPTELHNGRQYTLKVTTPPTENLLPLPDPDSASPGSPGSRRSRLSEMLEKISPLEEEQVPTPGSPETEPVQQPTEPAIMTDPIMTDPLMSEPNTPKAKPIKKEVESDEEKPRAEVPEIPADASDQGSSRGHVMPSGDADDAEDADTPRVMAASAAGPLVHYPDSPHSVPEDQFSASLKSNKQDPIAISNEGSEEHLKNSLLHSDPGDGAGHDYVQERSTSAGASSPEHAQAVQFSDVSGSEEEPLPTSAPVMRRKKVVPTKQVPTVLEPEPEPLRIVPTKRPSTPVMSDTELWKEFNTRLSQKGLICDGLTTDEQRALCEVNLGFSEQEASRLLLLIHDMNGKTAQEPAGIVSPSSLSIAFGEVNGRRDLVDPSTALYAQVESVVNSSLICSSDSSVQVFRVRQLIPGARICGQYNAAKQSLRPELRQKKVLYYAGPQMPTLTEITNEALFGELRRNGCLVFSTEACIPHSSSSSTTKMKLLLCELVMGNIGTPSQPTHVGKTGPIADFNGARKLLLQEQRKAVTEGMSPPDTLAIDYPYLSEASEEGQVATQYVTTDAARVLPRFVVYLEVKSTRAGVHRDVRPSMGKQVRGVSKTKKHNQLYVEKRLQEALTMKHYYQQEKESKTDVKGETTELILREFRDLQAKLNKKRDELLAAVDDVTSSAQVCRRENIDMLDGYINSLQVLKASPSSRPPTAPRLHETPSRITLDTAPLASAITQLTIQQQP